MAKIEIRIASYKDVHLAATLQSSFDLASGKHQLSYVVCIQDEKVPEEIKPLLESFSLTYIFLHSSKAKGPSYARALCDELAPGKDFVLQIDAHCLFKKDWDEILLNVHAKLPPRSLVSGILPGFTPPDTFYDKPQRLPEIHFHHNSLIPFFGPGKDFADAPVEYPFIMSGFIFSKGDFFKEIPNDPHYSYFEEQISLTLRAWTKGWRVFHILEKIIYHHYTSAQTDEVNHGTKEAAARYLELLRGELPAPWGLGKEKSIKEFLELYGKKEN